MAKKNAASAPVDASAIEITKDLGRKILNFLRGYLDDPKKNTPNPMYFRFRRFVNDVKTILAPDLEELEKWEKGVAKRRTDVMKKYAELMPNGELKETPAGYSPEGFPLVKRTFATKEKEDACQAELAPLNAEITEEAKLIDEQFSQKIKISGHQFKESEIPADMSNAEKGILELFTIEG